MFDQYEYWIKKAGKYTPTQEYLSIKCNISTGSVKNYIRLMEKLGMCKIVSKGAKGQTANSYVMYDYRKIDGILTKPSLKEYYEAKHLADEILEEWDIPASKAEPEAQEVIEDSHSTKSQTEPEPLQEPVITPDEPTHSLPIETPQNEAQSVTESIPESSNDVTQGTLEDAVERAISFSAYKDPSIRSYFTKQLEKQGYVMVGNNGEMVRISL